MCSPARTATVRPGSEPTETISRPPRILRPLLLQPPLPAMARPRPWLPQAAVGAADARRGWPRGGKVRQKSGNETLKAELKRHLLIVATLLPLVFVARYALFDDASEFSLFAEQLKRYLAPLVIVLMVVLIAGFVIAVSKKIDKLQQEKLATVFFWLSSIVLALAIVAVFVQVKLQGHQAVKLSVGAA